MKLRAVGGRLTAERGFLTSGTVNGHRAEFLFDSAWDGMLKTAVFRQGGTERSVFLGEEGACPIPWEVLSPGGNLYISVWGQRGEDTILTTNYECAGMVRLGANWGAQGSVPPAPDLYQQILDQIQTGMLTGPAGPAGASPEIGENGTWWVGGIDTGVPSSGGGAGEHALLTGRERPEQHTIEAISGLKAVLDALPAALEAHEKESTAHPFLVVDGNQEEV